MMAWFDFGVHTPFVWSVYGIALVIFGMNVLVPIIQHRRIVKRLAEENHRQGIDT